MLDPIYLGGLINKHALAYQLDPKAIACLVIQESGGDPLAARYEAHIHEALKPRSADRMSGYVPMGVSLSTEKVERACSWGLLQCLGETARWCAKYQGKWLHALTDPDLGMDVGCRVFRYYLDRNKGVYLLAYAAFNAGNPTSLQGQKYAMEVQGRYDRKEYLRFYP